MPGGCSWSDLEWNWRHAGRDAAGSRHGAPSTRSETAFWHRDARYQIVIGAAWDDPSEQDLPDIGQARFVDPETGATIDVDTSDVRVRARFAEAVAEELNSRRRLLRRLAIDEVPVRTDGGVVDPLIKFFRARETRSRRR